MAALTVLGARTRISLFTLATSFPTLSDAELDELLRMSKRASSPYSLSVANFPFNFLSTTTIPPDDYVEWQAGHVYVVGNTITPSTRNGHFYTATVAGTSASVAPTFPTDSGNTVADGGVTWQESGVALWIPTFQVFKGIASGWELKAAKVATAYDVESSTQVLHRSQMFEQCMQMVKLWKRKSTGQIELQGSLRDRNFDSCFGANQNCCCGLSTCFWCWGRNMSWTSPDDIYFGSPWDIGWDSWGNY